MSGCIAGSFTAAGRRWCASRCPEAAAGGPLPRRMPVSVKSPGRPRRRGPRGARDDEDDREAERGRALNSAARPKMMLATPNATAVEPKARQELGAQQYRAQW